MHGDKTDPIYTREQELRQLEARSREANQHRLDKPLPGDPVGGGCDTAGPMASCTRMSAAELCYSQARELRREAAQLEQLAGVLPRDLGRLLPEVDGLLWELLLKQGRR